MPYTLWLDERLIGETDFEHPGCAPAHRVGMLRPTAHGLDVLPGLCGFLSAASALKDAMEHRGMPTADPSADDVTHLLEDTPVGRGLIDVVKRLAQLVLRDPGGEQLPVESIAVTDLQELVSLGGMPVSQADGVAADAPRFVISATVESREWGAAAVQRRTQPRPRWRH